MSFGCTLSNFFFNDVTHIYGQPFNKDIQQNQSFLGTVVVWVVGISLDFKNFTHTLAIGFKSILLTTRPSSLTYDVPSMVRVVKMVFHFFEVNLSRNLAYSQVISAGKL